MKDLTNILGKNEDYLIEAKSAKGGFPDNFWETYSAFANTDGGTILLGVEETHDHVLYMQDGLADAQKMKETFWKLVNNRQKISHNIVTNSMVYIDQLEGKDILVVEVPRAERTTRPVYRILAWGPIVGGEKAITSAPWRRYLPCIAMLLPRHWMPSQSKRWICRCFAKRV